MREPYRPLQGLRVIVQHDNVEKAIRKLKKKVQEFGLLQELREREFYEKPSETSRRSRRRPDFRAAAASGPAATSASDKGR